MWWLLLACETDPEGLPDRIEDCRDAACRQEWILHPDHADPATQAAALATIAQPEERIVLVKRILDENPRQPPEICGQLPPGDARQYCERIQERPHLTEAAPQSSVTRQRPGGGPANIELGGLPGGGFVDALQPAEAGCEDASDVRACRSQAALSLTSAGQVVPAVRECLAIPAGKWRGECLFSVAEASLDSGVSYGRAMQVCMAAEPFTQQCHSHLISSLALRSPGASSPAADWQPVTEAARQIASGWAEFDVSVGELILDRFWSETVRLSYLEQPAVGDPLDHLPPHAHPHIRAALVWRLMEEGPRSDLSLAGWIEHAGAALARRAEQAVPPMPIQKRRHLSLWIRDHWSRDAPGEESIPATYYLGVSRRPVDADPQIDLTLCILEGLARQKNASHVPLDEAMQSEVAVIAWSARRLKSHR